MVVPDCDYSVAHPPHNKEQQSAVHARLVVSGRGRSGSTYANTRFNSKIVVQLILENRKVPLCRIGGGRERGAACDETDHH